VGHPSAFPGRNIGQYLAPEPQDAAHAGLAMFACLCGVAIERRRIAQRHPQRRLLAFRAKEGLDDRSQPLRRRLAVIVEQAVQQPARLLPFVGLQAEEYGLLVGEVLVEGSDADPRPLRHARRGEAARALPSEDLRCRLKDVGDQTRRTYLLRLLA